MSTIRFSLSTGTSLSARVGSGMMMRCSESALVSASSIKVTCDACDCGCTCPCFLGYCPVGFSCSNLLRHFKSLTPGFELRKCADVPEEVCDLVYALAGSKCFAEATEPRVRSPGVFGEAAFSHEGEEK